jgi:integrase
MSAASASRVPKYRRHKPTGQAVVTIDGQDIYLGKHGTAASRHEYDRIIGEWMAAGRCLVGADAGVAVAELARAYLKFAKGYYRKDGRPTGSLARVKTAVRTLRMSYGETRVSDFGPLALQAIQLRLVESGHSRRYVNYLVDTIRRIFKWGVAQEIVPETTYRALTAVSGLRRGRTAAPESAPVQPADDATVDATLPYLSPTVADMVRFQRLTGCRPGEVVLVRPMDVDTSGDVWLFVPESHKTEHHGRQRVIVIGPQAQDILRKYLLRPEAMFCFCPRETEKRRLALRHENRKTPLKWGNRPGTNRKRQPKRTAGERYTSRSYSQAIRRGVDKANRAIVEAFVEAGGKPENAKTLPRWSPNQLRHAAATEVRKRFGLEAAQVTLGHANARITEVYAERDLALAVRVMAEVG